MPRLPAGSAPPAGSPGHSEPPIPPKNTRPAQRRQGPHHALPPPGQAPGTGLLARSSAGSPATAGPLLPRSPALGNQAWVQTQAGCVSPRVGRAWVQIPPLSFPEQGSPPGPWGGRRAEGGPADRARGPGRAGPGMQSCDGLARCWETHQRPLQHHGRVTGGFQHAPAPRKMAAGEGRARRLLPAPDPRGQANTGRPTSCSPGPCWPSGGLPGRGVPPAPPASQGRGSLGSVGSSTGGGADGRSGL